MRRTTALLAVLAFAAGCQTLETLTKVGTEIAVGTGAINQTQADSINKTVTAVGKVFDNLTPENEYYIGRAVGANILKTYKPLDNPALNTYLNTMGSTLAMVSDRPYTFGGYHFLMLDTDEINAFAASGGLIFVSKGLINCCKSEDALAAVLAHEVAHVQLLHGLKAIQTSRLKDAALTAVLETGKALGGTELSQATAAFEGSISDIISKTVNGGYAKSAEYDADATAITILNRAGYNPAALKEMLQEIEKKTKPDVGFGKTHPAPADRISKIQAQLTGIVPSMPEARQARFAKAVAGL